MENLNMMFELIRNIWDQVFGVEYPGIGLSFKDIYIGAAVVSFSIWLFKRSAGLGSAAARDSVIRSRIASQSKLKP